MGKGNIIRPDDKNPKGNFKTVPPQPDTFFDIKEITDIVKPAEYHKPIEHSKEKKQEPLPPLPPMPLEVEVLPTEVSPKVTKVSLQVKVPKVKAVKPVTVKPVAVKPIAVKPVAVKPVKQQPKLNSNKLKLEKTKQKRKVKQEQAKARKELVVQASAIRADISRNYVIKRKKARTITKNTIDELKKNLKKVKAKDQSDDDAVALEINIDNAKTKLKKLKQPKQITYNMKGSPSKRLHSVARSGVIYEHAWTLSSTSIKVGNEKYYYGGIKYKLSEFHLQRKLKKEILDNIEKNNIKVPKYSNDHINYMRYSPDLGVMDTTSSSLNIREYDISKAYYVCAYRLGYIGNEMFEKCMNLTKDQRLRFIGSIATVKRTYTKKGYKVLKHKHKFNRKLRYVWFHICKYVDECLNELRSMVGENFIMYYVDGIYLKKYHDADMSDVSDNQSFDFIDYSEMIKYVSEKYGFHFKEVPSLGYRIEVEPNRGYRQVIVCKKENGKVKEKEFTMKNSKDKDVFRSNVWREELTAWNKLSDDQKQRLINKHFHPKG